MSFFKKLFSFCQPVLKSTESIAPNSNHKDLSNPQKLFEVLKSLDLNAASNLLTQVKNLEILSQLRNIAIGASDKNSTKEIHTLINQNWEKKIQEILHSDQSHFISHLLQDVLKNNPAPELLYKILAQIQHLPVLLKEEIISQIDNDKILFALLKLPMNEALESKIKEKIKDPKYLKKIKNDKADTSLVKEVQKPTTQPLEDRRKEKTEFHTNKLMEYFDTLDKMKNDTSLSSARINFNPEESKQLFYSLLQNLKSVTNLSAELQKEYNQRFENSIITIVGISTKEKIHLQKKKEFNPTQTATSAPTTPSPMVSKPESTSSTNVFIDTFTPLKEKILASIETNKDVVLMHKEWLKYQKTNALKEDQLKFINQQFQEYFKKVKSKGEEKEWAKWSQKLQFEKILQEAKLISQNHESGTLSKEDCHKIFALKNEWYKTSKLAHNPANEVLWNEIKLIFEKVAAYVVGQKTDIFLKTKETLSPTLLLKAFTIDNVQEIPLAQITQTLKELQEEFNSWPLITGQNNDRKINTDFKTLLHEYFSKLKKYHEQLQISKEDNYKSKLELLEQAKTLLASLTNENPNSKEVTIGLKEIQKKWSKIGHIPTDKMELQEDFHKLLQDYFNTLHHEFEGIINEKTSLLDLVNESILKATSVQELEKIQENFFEKWDAFSYHPKNQTLDEKFETVGNTFKQTRSTLNEQESKECLDALHICDGLLENPPLPGDQQHYSSVLEKIQIQENILLNSKHKNAKDILKKVLAMKNLWIKEYEEDKLSKISKSKEDLLLELQIIGKIAYPQKDFGPIPENLIAQSIKLGQEIKKILPHNDPDKATELVIEILQQFPYATKHETYSPQNSWQQLRKSYQQFF